MNKKDGLYNTVCPRDCYGGCGLQIEIKNNELKSIKGSHVNDNSKGFYCAKGASYLSRLKHPQRLLTPLLKNNNKFIPIDWEEAYDLIINKLNELKAKEQTESVFYLMGYGTMGALNEYSRSFWHQYGDITSTYGSLCMSGGKKGFQYTYGNTVRQNKNEYIESAKLIIIWGANPANTNIHRMRHIKNAVKNGAKLIVIDPRVSESMIDGCTPIHPVGGTDGLLAIGIAKILVEKNCINKQFIEKNTIGFDEYVKEINKHDFDDIVSETGVSLEEIKMIAQAIEESPDYALVTGSGKARYDNAGQTERCVSALPALTGSIGKENNGIYFLDSQQPKVNWHNYPKDQYTYKEKTHVGMIAYDIEALNPSIEMLWMEKVNPMASNPDINSIKKVFDQIPFKVVVEHFMTETAKEADLVLPAAMFSEKNDLLTVYGDSYIQLQQQLLEPAGRCKSEVDIYRELGIKMDFDLRYLPAADEKGINELLNDNNISTDYQSLCHEPYLFEAYKPIAYADMYFDTPSGKIEFYSEDMKKSGEIPVPTYIRASHIVNRTDQYPLHLLSAHSKNMINSQFKEMTVNDSPSFIEINYKDADPRNILDGDLVTVFNENGEVSVIAHVNNKVREGMVHMYHGKDSDSKSNVNRLVRGQQTDFGDGTAYHNNNVEIYKNFDI